MPHPPYANPAFHLSEDPAHVNRCANVPLECSLDTLLSAQL